MVSDLNIETSFRAVERFENAHKSKKRELPGWERPRTSSGDVTPSQPTLF